jgi:outer membrane protein OmpA-like peptidoglycan-associated protein
MAGGGLPEGMTMDGELGQNSVAVGEESHWIPLTDLMTGLMVIFLLIAVSYMMQVEADAARIKNVAVAYSEIKDALFEDLNKEFRLDLSKWKAQLLKNDLTIRFSEPEVLFATGSTELKPEFQAILQDFFPRYVRILTSPKYRDSISEVRIEGHTSSDWNGVAAGDAYFLNMELSQARTRSTLAYVLNLPADREQVAWLRRFVTANGLSSSRLIMDNKGMEDVARSRRVEFRIRTDAETRLAKILEVTK